MKWFIIIIFLFLKSFDSVPINSNETRFSNPVQYWMHIIKNEFVDLVSTILFDASDDETDDKNNKYEKIDALYDLIESLDPECFGFIVNFFFEESHLIEKLCNNFFHDGGVVQNSLGVENDCILRGVYLLFTSNSTIKSLKKDTKDSRISSKEAIFRESFNWREEICFFKECRKLYIMIIDYFLKFQKDLVYQMFNTNRINLTWINYEGFLNSSNNDIEMIKYKKQKMDSEEPYFKKVSLVLFSIIIFFVLVIIVIWLINENHKTTEANFKVQKNKSKDNIKKRPTTYDINQENILLYKEKKLEDFTWYKVIRSFDFLNNISILNKKKEPLSDQTSLIELSTLKILILFFILMGENCYIFLKYIENKLSILPFIREQGFIFTKIGMNSYESYKVINGVFFGFKFISFYNKSNGFSVKNFFIFCTKPFPYILTFVIIHFLFNYPIFIFARKAHEDDYKSFYLSEIMCNYYCQENPYNIFKIFSILGKYSFMNGYDIKQFNGCTRPILFIFSELICFYIVMILVAINICFKKKIINIIYIIFFCCNFLLLGMTKFISREVQDLVDEFTISRFFGLSETLAMPYLFFGLYYIGFNLGIIYYYHLNEISNKLIADTENETKNFIPFQYCFNISSYIMRIYGFIKNIFIIIFVLLMISMSSIYTFIVRKLNDTELIFTFEERPDIKYLCTYEGILFGLFFACFLLFYLCLDANSFFKNILSSEIFSFSNKISFILFISFYSVLYYFHILELMEIFLSNFSIFKNSLTLFFISCIISIVFSCMIHFPIKWIYLFICHGFKNEEYNQIL